MPTRCSGVRRLVLVASVLIFGCGRGPTPPPSQAPEAGSEAIAPAAPAAGQTQSVPAAPPVAPAPASEPSRATTDALEGEAGDELARAERELAEADQTLAGSTETSAAAAERDDGAPGRGAAPTKPKSSANQPPPCVITCKAFASLVRARDSICRIDGSDGGRCNRANQIVERHTARSTSCGCGG